MKAHGVLKLSGWFGVAVLLVVLMPMAALAQWTIPGDASIAGKLGVGIQTPARGFHLQGRDAIFQIDRDRDPAAFLLARTADGDFSTIHKAYLFGVKGPGVNDGEFTIRDMGNAVGGWGGDKRLTIANDGQISFGDLDEPLAGLHVLNPVAGNILRLDGSGGAQVFTVQNDGDMYARGADLEVRLSETSTGGYDLGNMSTVLGNTGQSSDEAFLALNGQTAVLCSSGDEGLLKIVDQDNYGTYYKFSASYLYLGATADFKIAATNQHTGDDLILSTTGEQIKFVADSNGDTVNFDVFTWYNNGTANLNRAMELESDGDLNIAGTLTQNASFDLAEAYWKSEDGIEAGDVVRIDPEEPNAVVLARTANDRAVVGVVSTDPGIIMGGGAFSAEKLADLWGEEVGTQFAKERKSIEKSLVNEDEYIQGRTAKVGKMKSSLPKRGKKADVAKAKAEVAEKEQQLADAIEDAVIQSFCEDHLAQVALAGRVPVKVDASYGAIQVGDLLVASATAGHAMRSDDPRPGTVVGKALEPLASGQGAIMMMVLNR